MLRNDFIKNVAERCGEPQTDVRKILEAIEDEREKVQKGIS